MRSTIAFTFGNYINVLPNFLWPRSDFAQAQCKKLHRGLSMDCRLAKMPDISVLLRGQPIDLVQLTAGDLLVIALRNDSVNVSTANA